MLHLNWPNSVGGVVVAVVLTVGLVVGLESALRFNAVAVVTWEGRAFLTSIKVTRSIIRAHDHLLVGVATGLWRQTVDGEWSVHEEGVHPADWEILDPGINEELTRLADEGVRGFVWNRPRRSLCPENQ